jgi:hypothetical protein
MWHLVLFLISQNKEMYNGYTTLLLYAFQPSLPTMKKLTVHQDIDIHEQRVIRIHENRVSLIFYFDQQPT